MYIIDIDQVYRWSLDLSNNEIVECQFAGDSNEISLEQLDVKFSAVENMFKWILNNDDLIAHRKRLSDLDYLLEPEYYRQRFEGVVDKVYIVLKEDNVAVMKVPVANSIEIDATSFDKYKEGVLQIIFK